MVYPLVYPVCLPTNAAARAPLPAPNARSTAERRWVDGRVVPGVSPGVMGLAALYSYRANGLHSRPLHKTRGREVGQRPAHGARRKDEG